MTDIRTETVIALVSSVVSAGDGRPYTLVQPQPAALDNPPVGAGVSLPGGMLWMEVLRRAFTHITSPSATLASGGSAGSILVGFGTSGIAGKIQGWPFVLSGTAATLSAAPTSLVSTTSTTIRRVLVTIGHSAFVSGMSSLAVTGGTLQFVYGSAMTTSAGAVTSGGPAASYFDLAPLPFASAHEVPVGELRIPNSFATSAGISNTMMLSDYRILQGMNFSAMMQGMPQPS
jgi:hypothetical protein